jgi:hypothetical protein
MKEASICIHLDNNQETLTKRDRDSNHVESLENGNGKSITSGFSSDGIDTTVFNTEEKRHMAVKDPSLFPDGGLRAWSVVGASFLLVFCTFGDFRSSKY